MVTDDDDNARHHSTTTRVTYLGRHIANKQHKLDTMKSALKQLHWLLVKQRITYRLCVPVHAPRPHRTSTTIPQFMQPASDTGWGQLAQRFMFPKEQELDMENVVSFTLVQPPGIFFLPTFMTLLTPVHSENNSRMYFSIVLTTDYCWHSWTCHAAASYRSVEWPGLCPVPPYGNLQLSPDSLAGGELAAGLP